MMTHGRRSARVIATVIAAVLAISLLASFVALGDHKPASDDLCGTTITTDLKLDHDLVCTSAGQGISVGLDGIRIELRGHTISGPGGFAGSGIAVHDRNDVEIVGPGTVTGFSVGISVVRSSRVEVERIDIVGNGGLFGEGILVWSSTDVEIERNRIVGNVADGIEVRESTGLDVVRNEIQGNDNGINLATITTGNSFERNWISGNNACGVLGPVGDNTFKNNRFDGNPSNFC